MEKVLYLVEELLILYCIGLGGFIAKRANIFDKQADEVLTNLILYITLPSLILFSMDFPFSSAYILTFSQLVFLSGYALITACLIAYLVNKKTPISESRSGVYQSLMIFGNQGFIGYAVSYILFAETGIVFAACFNLLYLILIWSYCPYLIGKKKASFSWRSILLSPGILATLGGVVLWVSPVHWPGPLLKIFEDVGKMTIPLSMLMVGGMLADLKGKELLKMVQDRYIWIACLVRLVGIPLLLFPFIFTTFPFKVIAVAILITASPSAPTTSLFANKYGNDTYFASVGVFLSTLLAVLTLPLLYTFLLWAHSLVISF